MNIDKTELLDDLREIMAEEPWDQDALTDWAINWLHRDNDDLSERYEEESRQERRQIAILKPQVVPYKHNPNLPALPDSPDGQLHGIGFIYDEDRDDRVLVAIDQLKSRKGIVALAEHEGMLAIYSRKAIGLNSISVCGDEWCVTEFVPYRGRWEEVTKEFLDRTAWQNDPATAKQVAFLRNLGYTGPDPETKGEAGALIGEYKSKQETAILPWRPREMTVGEKSIPLRRFTVTK